MNRKHFSYAWTRTEGISPAGSRNPRDPIKGNSNELVRVDTGARWMAGLVSGSREGRLVMAPIRTHCSRRECSRFAIQRRFFIRGNLFSFCVFPCVHPPMCVGLRRLIRTRVSWKCDEIVRDAAPGASCRYRFYGPRVSRNDVEPYGSHAPSIREWFMGRGTDRWYPTLESVTIDFRLCPWKRYVRFLC